MTAKSEEKREFILRKAKEVFIRKGFTAVTMKDIIEECGISRGGIYLYFKSVDEVFMQLIIARNKRKLKEARDYLSGDKSFGDLLDGYLAKQKKRLMHISGTLLVAMYEYRFAHRNDYDREFFSAQLENTKTIVLELLSYGVRKGEVSEHGIGDLAAAIVFMIEGISMLGTAAAVPEEVIDKQLHFIKQMIFSHGGEKL